MKKHKTEAESIAIFGFIFWAVGTIAGIIGIFLYPLVWISLFTYIVGIAFEIWALVLSIKNA